jgi:23S rRNA (adenine2503-C2)-methyltransferase
VNPVAESGFRRSSDARIRAFERGLREAGIEVSLRAERGTDIDAACGQLRQRVTDEL